MERCVGEVSQCESVLGRGEIKMVGFIVFLYKVLNIVF